MEKYGVEEVPPDKTASDPKTCPGCGRPLRDPNETGILVCDQCGTAPFEKK